MPTDDTPPIIIPTHSDYVSATVEFGTIPAANGPEHHAWAAHVNGCAACQQFGPCEEGERLLLAATGEGGQG
jgi:hypothetical protein